MSPAPGQASTVLASPAPEGRGQAERGWILAGAASVFLFGLAYFAALDNGFVSDDWFFLAEARNLLDTGDFGRVFSFRSEWFYRPLQFLLTALLCQLTGVEVWSYRLVVIALHAANGLLLGRLAFRLLRRAPSSALPARELAWLTAACFLFSPRNHEAVFWYAAASEPVAMFFRLTGLLLLIEALETSGRRSWLAAFGVVAAFAAALATKEPSIAFGAEAGLVFLFMLVTARAGRRRELVARGAVIGAGLVAVALIWLSGYLGVGLSLPRSKLVPLEASPVEWALRLLQGFFRQFFFSPMIGLASTLWKLAGVLLFCLAGAAAKKRWLVLLAFSWDLVLLAPYVGTTAAADQINRVPILLRPGGFDDRYLYYPSAGLALLLIAFADFLIDLARSRPSGILAGRRALIVLVVSWAILGTCLLRQREADWDRAGELARQQSAPLAPLAPTGNGYLCLTRVPESFDHYRGAYVLRNALPNLLYVQLGRRDFQVLVAPMNPWDEAQCALAVDLDALLAGKQETIAYPLPDLMLERLAACLAERQPMTQVGESRETMVYVHLFKRDNLRKVGQFLQPSATWQQLEKPDEALLFFRLWVGGHRSAVLTSELLLASFEESLEDPAFRLRLLAMADELGSRPEVEALLAAPLELPPVLRLYGHLRLLLPGPYAACAPGRPSAGAEAGQAKSARSSR